MKGETGLKKSDVFRNDLYAKYNTIKMGGKPLLDKESPQRIDHRYDIYLRKWIPEDRSISILDVGCGTGTLLYSLKRKGYINVCGIDISSEQVRIARQIVDNIIEGNAIEYLDSHPSAFDLILGVDIIEHLRKDEAINFLKACYKALRKNGRLILQTPNAESPWGGFCMYGDFTHEVFYQPLWLKKLLQLTGFMNIEIKPTGPVVHGIVSLIRFLVWKIIWTFLVIWNLAERGDIGSGVYTRVFIISGIKGT